jgi:mRNA interferase HicA
VNGEELLRKLRKLAKSKGVAFRFDPSHGKGSHGRVTFGSAFTTVKDLKKDIGKGLLSDLCKDLGIDPKEL